MISHNDSVSAHTWFATHTSSRSDWVGQDLLHRKESRTVAVILPALDEEATIGDIVGTVHRELLGSLVDDLIVVDSGSRDATATIARESGARVVTAPRPGKGAAMHHGVGATDADIVVFVDADLRSFTSQVVVSLLGPLLTDDRISFVKAAYDRPAIDPSTPSSGGGRVTELMARPLISAFWPELNGVLQPLAGEYAARRSLLASLPFRAGYGVDLGLLVDAYHHVGLDGLAQVDLHRRWHRNAELANLGAMAAEILHTALDRIHADNGQPDVVARATMLWQPARLEGGVAVTEREIDTGELPALNAGPHPSPCGREIGNAVLSRIGKKLGLPP